MGQSKNFKKVQDFYGEKLWDVFRVRDAVVKKWITEDEFFLITGIEY